jgi:5-(carboxyamino)imidazole ribonucleotide synthase
MTVPPGSTIGIIGGGQLGRMLAVAAAQLGYHCHILDPNPRAPAAQVSANFTRADYDDLGALREFADGVDVATYEFENLPTGPLQLLGDKLRPSIRSLAIAQDRAKEKAFIEECGGRVAAWRSISAIEELESAAAALGCPLVLKTRRWGYDGKGQSWARTPSETAQAWSAIGEEPAVAEAAVDFIAEFSVIVARWEDGHRALWDSPRNEHGGGILRRSSVPCGEAVAAQVTQAREAALRIAEALGHIGVLTVEFFASRDGPIVNEIAPRVHNSGHWTIEGAVTSQFEQHIRAICGLPPGPTELIGAGAVMDNLIGDEVERWPELTAEPGLHVHIYGKGEARPGRKMGHVTRVSPRA